MGGRSTSKSGKVCIPWQKYKMSKTFVFPEGFGSDVTALTLAHNYCRNPILNKKITGERPYCYTDENDAKEECDVSKCSGNMGIGKIL